MKRLQASGQTAARVDADAPTKQECQATGNADRTRFLFLKFLPRLAQVNVFMAQAILGHETTTLKSYSLIDVLSDGSLTFFDLLRNNEFKRDCLQSCRGFAETYSTSLLRIASGKDTRKKWT